MTQLMIHAYTYKYLKIVYQKYVKRSKYVRHQQVINSAALRLQTNYRLKMRCFGDTPFIRDKHTIRSFLTAQTQITSSMVELRAKRRLLKFLRSTEARSTFKAHLRGFPEFVDKWGMKATLVRK